MDAKIIALQCPSCGNSRNIKAKDARFGFRFACGYCKTESLLVINQQLHIPKADEHVCLKCGRVARPGARFCQCGGVLVQKCAVCRKEFPVDYEVCEHCGARGGLPVGEYEIRKRAEDTFDAWLDEQFAKSDENRPRS